MAQEIANRALRVYRGPNDHAPFMSIINSLSEQCSNMMGSSPNGIVRLSRDLPNGYVSVMRVAAMATSLYEMEFVNTVLRGGDLYIILVASSSAMWNIPVKKAPNGYVLGYIEQGKKGIVEAYNTYPDLSPSIRESCPYIIHGDTNYASVGTQTGLPGFNGWHSHPFTYTGMPSSCVQSDEIFRPYGRVWSMHAGPIAHWHASMSSVTATANHLSLERYIDQQKKNYFPRNMIVTFGPGESANPFFSQLSATNLLLPANPIAYYGKRPYTTENGVVTSYGEAIVGSIVLPTLSEPDIIPTQFFWPFIPYLEEIGHFNILSYSTGSIDCSVLAPLYQWSMRYYPMSGDHIDTIKVTDSGVFTNSTKTDTYSFPITVPNNQNNANGKNSLSTTDPCAIATDMNDLPPSYADGNPCYNATGKETISNTTGAYTSIGSKHVPIGSIGGKAGCFVKTDWSVSGSGPVYNYSKDISTVGNLPVKWFVDNGFMVPMAEYWPPATYRNQSSESASWTETAENTINLSQSLMFGDDIIDSGSGTMSFTMSRSGTSEQTGYWEIILSRDVTTVCDNTAQLLYTTNEMYIGGKQTFYYNTGCTCGKVRWTATGGTMNPLVSTSYTPGAGYSSELTITACETAFVTATCDCGGSLSAGITVIGYPANITAYTKPEGGTIANSPGNWGLCYCISGIIGYDCYGNVTFHIHGESGSQILCGDSYGDFSDVGKSCGEPIKRECILDPWNWIAGNEINDLRTSAQKVCGCSNPELAAWEAKEKMCFP